MHVWWQQLSHEPAVLDVGKVSDPALLAALQERFGAALVYRL